MRAQHADALAAIQSLTERLSNPDATGCAADTADEWRAVAGSCLRRLPEAPRSRPRRQKQFGGKSRPYLARRSLPAMLVDGFVGGCASIPYALVALALRVADGATVLPRRPDDDLGPAHSD